MKRLITLALFLISANVTAEHVYSIEPTVISENGCKVTVYQTYHQALKGGEIVELCIVDGSSKWQVKHTTEKAIERNAPQICECGTDKAYVLSRTESDGTTAHVTLVAFKYQTEKKSNHSPSVDPYDAIKRKKD